MLRKLQALSAIVLLITCGVFSAAGPASARSNTNYDYITNGLSCIHKYEASWDGIGYVRGKAIYYGGLQMDTGFMQTYGAEYYKHFGTADRWPIYIQLAVAVKAYLDRGWNPWPNTRRMCNL